MPRKNVRRFASFQDICNFLATFKNVRQPASLFYKLLRFKFGLYQAFFPLFCVADSGQVLTGSVRILQDLFGCIQTYQSATEPSSTLPYPSMTI